MRKWISVFLLVLAVTAVTEATLVGGIVPTKPGIVKPLSHGEGG
jgi:hypothetical protein